MASNLYQVDAFTDRPFSGNPAAVCLLSGPRDDAWMQAVASEMNLSETAFVSRRDDGFDLRWFTPTTEVELCGHATLASAHVLWEAGMLAPADAARFHTRSGWLTARRLGNEIELDLPALASHSVAAPPDLARALGASPRHVAKGKFDYLIELGSEREVRDLRPDFVLLRTIPAEGFIVTSVATTPGFDVVSRFFAPAMGIDEDPVTGAAHCCLGPHWCHKLNRTELVAYQASARGGKLRVRVGGDRVHLAGRAVTVLKGALVAD